MRVPAKPFKKGNPGGPGRPKGSVETPAKKLAKAIARELAEPAIQRLRQWMESDNPKASVAACIAILNRAEGLPKQEIEHSGQTTQYVIADAPAELTTAEWLREHYSGPTQTTQ